MRKHKRRSYKRSIAVTRILSFFGGCWIVHPGVYRRPWKGPAKPDRTRIHDDSDLHFGA